MGGQLGCRRLRRLAAPVGQHHSGAFAKQDFDGGTSNALGPRR